MEVTSKMERLQTLKSIQFPKYGRSVGIVAWNLFRQLIRERRLLLSAVYFIVVPIFLISNSVLTAVQTGSGIALFYAHRNIENYIRTFYLSFFLGQILIVVLSADQLAGEIEQDTYALLRSKPVRDSEIVIGKFFGLLGVVSLLDLPGYLYIYFYSLITYQADTPAYIGTIDEIIGGFLLLLLLQSIIIAITLLFSSLFSKNLYSILASLIFIYIISIITGLIQGSNTKIVDNYLSIDWLAQAILPSVLYHLEPLESHPDPVLVILSILAVIAGALGLTTVIMRNREIF